MEEKSRHKVAWHTQKMLGLSYNIQAKRNILVDTGDALLPHIASWEKIQIALRK